MSVAQNDESGQQEPPTPNGKALSTRSYANSVATTSPALDLTDVEELLHIMKRTLGTLGATFDTLGEQTARIATLGPAMDSAHQVHRLRKQLDAQDRRHEDRIGEIKILLREVLKDQIIAHLSTHVHEMIREGVAKVVKEHVAKQLTEQIPQQLREQVEDHKRQIEHVKRSLFNSEGRRGNSLLRSNHLTEPLHPLLRPNGQRSNLFPRDLATLFGLNSYSAKQLVTEFELPVSEGEPSSREKNLNRFMQHIGVAFLMVPHDRKEPLATERRTFSRIIIWSHDIRPPYAFIFISGDEGTSALRSKLPIIDSSLAAVPRVRNRKEARGETVHGQIMDGRDEYRSIAVGVGARHLSMYF